MIAANLNHLTEATIGTAIEDHRAIGPGLLESTCEECLRHELSLRNIPFHRHVPLPVSDKGVQHDCGYRLDLIAVGQVVLELKSVDVLSSIQEARPLTNLKLSRYRVSSTLTCLCLKTTSSAIFYEDFAPSVSLW